MDYFAGLDVSLDETSICIIDDKGKILKETKAATDPEAIRLALKAAAGRLARIGVEASSLGCWLYTALLDSGLSVIVVETRHMRSALNAQRIKTDRKDALGIAQMMRLGWYRAVHVKSDTSQRLRVLLSNRQHLKRKLIDLENHIRGTIRAFGLKVGSVARGKFKARVLELTKDAPPDIKTYIATMLEVRSGLLKGFNALHELVVRIVETDTVCRRLMTVPGVGPITALSFRAGVDDPSRFKRSRSLGAHFGLTPKRHQSGTVDIEGHITKQGDRDVRTALCEAAASLLLRVRQWTALKAWGLKLAKRTSMMNAIVAVARKLASILHRIWVDGTVFYRGGGASEKRNLRPVTA